MMEQVKFLENFLERHTSSVIKTRTLQAKVMLSVEESSSVESKHVASLDSIHEPSPKTTNIEGKITSSFGVLYQIRGLWQYLKVIMAQKAHK